MARPPRPTRRTAVTIRLVVGDVGRLNIGLLAAGVAFYGLLALFPAIAALTALWSLVADPAAVSEQLALFAPLLPEAVYATIAAQATRMAEGPSQTLGLASLASLAAALWAVRAGVGALLRGLNAAYEVTPRAGLGPTLRALSLTLVLLAVALIALACVVAAPIVLAFVPLGALTTPTVEATRWSLAVLSVLLGVALLYRYGPNRPAPRRGGLVTRGAILAVALWAAVSWGFSLYLQGFAAYDAVYGSLGAVVALLMWLYFSAYAVMLGALVDAARDRIAEAQSPGLRRVPRAPTTG